jgi:DNA helicase INO80
LKVSLSKLKGKVKQQREPSLDSASTGTPKTRKRPGPKKKTGLALEVETEQGSRPASLLGDVTPASRPSSPAPLNTTMVYELDEQMPPMKKAKKVDDSILIKRIKTLEEAQKKVWTNLARRDIVKVSDLTFQRKRCITRFLGLQVSYNQPSDTSGTVGTYRKACFNSSPQAFYKDC